MHTLSDLKHWLRQVLRNKEPNIHELEQIYGHFKDMGYEVEYAEKGKRKYIKVKK